VAGREDQQFSTWPADQQRLQRRQGRVPDAKVILHLANGYDNAVFRWFFDGVKAAGAKWDVIGMSHYPPASDWANYNARSPPICGTWWRATPSRSW
jgi:hypothetical protein